MSHDQWILQVLKLKSFIRTCWLHFVPWHPFSSLVGYLTYVNNIHQWLIIRCCLIMFDLNTFIHVIAHVPSTVCVEDLILWWHYIYATTLIVTVPMGFKFSYQSNVFFMYQMSSFNMETRIHCVLYMAMTTYDICPLCIFMAIVSICT